MQIDYIIVQAGGRGSRLGELTENKPKALVPVDNLPMLFHLFRLYPGKRFIIIADYKREVLREYLECFAEVKYQIVESDDKGTCAGIRQALSLLPGGKPFLLVWSDLILPESCKLPTEDGDYIGISKTFPCRWSYAGREFKEEPSFCDGVAGYFIFQDKSRLEDVPASGELVRWMQEKEMKFKELSLAGTKEFGLLEEYRKLEPEKCRPFNKLTIDGDVLIKEGIDEQGRQLAKDECLWYDFMRGKGVSIIPKIYGVNPLRMEYIPEGGILDKNELSYNEKREILSVLVKELQKIHELETVPADSFSISDNYYFKTFRRINSVRNLIPFANEPDITINGKKCRNIFYHKGELKKCIEQLQCDTFCVIHGDCTFSNILLRGGREPVLIDPRGYFGYTKIYGDPMYDWAKLYYSIVGNYDKFNIGKRRLTIEKDKVSLAIQSNHWEDMEETFFQLTGVDPWKIKLLHGIIWISLTTYAWQDYDSICGAFYNGLYYLEDVL